MASHTDTHHAAALDEHGRLLGDAAFATSIEGYRELLAWLERFGPVERVGVESTGSYAAGLARYLAGRGIAVVEVNQPHAHERRRRGKSDPIDAEAAARKVLAGEATAIPKHSGGIVESIRQLRVAREGAVKANTAALNQLYEFVITAPDELRQQLATRKTSRGKATLCLRLRPDRTRLHEPLQAAKLALRSVAERVRELDRQIALLDSHLSQLVATAAPRTTSLLGVSTQHAGQLLVSAGQNIERLANDGAFARLCGASPIPATSGRMSRHQLNRGGDRQANRALHLIAVCRLRYCARTLAYANRRTAEGLTKPEIIRCLKRYIARELYHTLRADLADLNPPSAPPQSRSTAAPEQQTPPSPDAAAAPAPALDIYRNVLVERWFAELTTKKLRRGSHRSVHELNTDIRDWIATRNDNQRPFWTKTTDEILNSIIRYGKQTNDSRH